MIKVFCDKCGKEIAGNVNIETKLFTDGKSITELKDKELYYCDECVEEELTCGFKVGDQVITFDGRVGTIIDICTCDRCKKRGFYEPRVKTEIGSGEIWITNRDKELNFNSFYQIGDHVFGNIDEECVLIDVERKKEDIKNAQKELIELEAQLNVVKKLKDLAQQND